MHRQGGTNGLRLSLETGCHPFEYSKNSNICNTLNIYVWWILSYFKWSDIISLIKTLLYLNSNSKTKSITPFKLESQSQLTY